MTRNNFGRSGVLLALFTLSGFAGLIYQSIWSQYLGLTLGHAAYAQTLVLAIYMGGMALGSLLANRLLTQANNSISTYGWVELAIAIFGFSFQGVFQAYSHFSQETVLPHLAGSWAHLYQWISAAFLILPQCILLGMTFPLMAVGCLRIQGEGPGWSLGGLYFTNSIGAALGALTATFILLPHFGLPGAMTVASIMNVIVAVFAWRLSRNTNGNIHFGLNIVQKQESALPVSNDIAFLSPRFVASILCAAAITGATSFVYEIVWVRLLNQALGTTVHSFELMLASFILGLALGAYWIHRYGDRIGNALRYAGFAQVLMGIAALFSALVFGQSFHWVGWMVLHFPQTESGYMLFNLGSAGIALVVMFPAAFFAGMTLPLFTMSLLRTGRGEASIGRIYAANTIGAILGVILTMHVLIPLFGVYLSLVLAAIIDVILGLYLLHYFSGHAKTRNTVKLSGLAAAGAVVCALLFGRPDPISQASGIFRTGKLLDKDSVRVSFLDDGKTSTVSVLTSIDNSEAAIATNGKPDAGMTLSLSHEPIGDEVTMIMAAALPLALHAEPKNVAVIGWGSGLTTHSFLGSKNVRKIETIEIEPVMYQGARLFKSRVARAYQDPRSFVIFDDARTYFSTGQKHYDIIFSEPSNPWVSGVASLFTRQFYSLVRNHLNKNGLFVQWLQSYEISDALLAQIVAAFLEQFPETQVYLTNDSDLLLVASNGEKTIPDVMRVRRDALGSEMSRVGLDSQQSFDIRHIGGPEILRTYVKMLGAKEHSDYYPDVALGAPKSRFLNESASLLPYLVVNGLPVLDLINGRTPVKRTELVAGDNASLITHFQLFAGLLVDSFDDPRAMQSLKALAPGQAQQLNRLLAMSRQKVVPQDMTEWSTDAAAMAGYTLGALQSGDLQTLWLHPQWLAAGQSPAVNTIMAAYAAAALREPTAMRQQAVAVLNLHQADIASALREQMLVIAMLGAIGEGNYPLTSRLEATYGASFSDSKQYSDIRKFLLAWADR